MTKIFKLISLLYLIINSLSIAIADENFFNKGLKLFKDKKYEDARFMFERGIVFNPKDSNSYLYLAKIYNFKKNDNQEEKNLNTVILLNPKNEEAILKLALLKIRKSNYEETKKLIKNFKVVCKKMCNKTSDLQQKLDTVLKK